MGRRPLWIRSGLLALSWLLGFAHAADYNLVPFDYPGATATYFLRINDAGQILGFYLDSDNARHCFLRSSDGATYTPLGDAPGATPGMTTCSGLNNSGQVAGSFQDAKGIHQYLRSAGGEFTIFDVPRFAIPGSFTAGLNDRGEIVGSLGTPPEGNDGFLRKADGSFVYLEAGAFGSIAPTAINNLGVVAGWVLNGSSQGTQHGFLRSADGVYTKFDLPGTASYTRILALNDAGQFAGVWIGGPGFVSNADGSFTLLPGYDVEGINGAGTIVGSHFDGKTTHAFLGTPRPGSTDPVIRTALPGVLTAANFGGASTVAPGSWIEIYGQNLASNSRTWRDADFPGTAAPTSLDGVSVSIGGIPAYVSYISPGQVNAIVPSGVPPGTALVTLRNGDRVTAPYSLTVADFRPAILSLLPTFSPLRAAAVAVFPDFTTYVLPPSYTNVPTRRAKAGDTIVFFGAGFGKVTPDVPIGQVAPSSAALQASVQFSFSRAGPPVNGQVTYAGLVPGTVGLYQFNVVLPDIPFAAGELASDFVSCSVTVGAIPANGRLGLTISMTK